MAPATLRLDWIPARVRGGNTGDPLLVVCGSPGHPPGGFFCRGVAQRQRAGLITRRSQVRILSPLPTHRAVEVNVKGNAATARRDGPERRPLT